MSYYKHTFRTNVLEIRRIKMAAFYMFIILGVILLAKGFVENIKRIEADANVKAMLERANEANRKGDEEGRRIDRMEKEFRDRSYELQRKYYESKYHKN